MEEPVHHVASHGGISSSVWLTALAIVAIPLAVLFKKLFFPVFDSQEPPVIKAEPPAIGHLVSMAQERTGFYRRLYDEHSLPICTLPMLTGKMYVINSPDLISSAMRNKALSFDPIQQEYAGSVLGMPKKDLKVLTRPDNLDKMMDLIHSSMTGEDLNSMAAVGLESIASTLNVFGPKEAVGIIDAFDWLSRNMFTAIMKALYGKKNPMTVKGMNDLFTYQKGVGTLAVNIAPGILAYEAIAARGRAQEMLAPFYTKKHYEGEDVSAFVRKRAQFKRELGTSDEDLAKVEFVVPWVSTMNTIPTLYWLFAYTVTEAKWVRKIQREMEAVAVVTKNEGREGRTALINMSRLRKECPALLACYQETTRLCNDHVGNRRVLQDTTLEDPANGRKYLLKKGTHVQWASSIVHQNPAVWGLRADKFDPTKWLDVGASDPARKKSMIPFGGGKTLCPGKHFAEAEILGFVGGLLLSYDVKSVEVPEKEDPYHSGGVKRPIWDEFSEKGVTLKRRGGWEDVRVKFEC